MFVMLQRNAQPRRFRQRVDYLLRHSAIARHLSVFIFVHKYLNGAQQAHYLFFGYLHPAPDELMRRCVGECGVYQIRPPAKYARPLRPANRLAAAVYHHIGALGGKAPQIGARRRHRRGVHNHRNAARVRYLAHLREWDGAPRYERRKQVCHRRRVLRERRLKLPRLTASSVADLHELSAHRLIALVIREAVALMDDDFVLHTAGVGQAAHLGGIRACDNRRGLQHEAACRAAGHKARLCARSIRDNAACGAVKLVDIHHHPRRLVHRVQDFRTNLAAAVSGSAARCGNNALNAQRAVDALRVPAPFHHFTSDNGLLAMQCADCIINKKPLHTF